MTYIRPWPIPEPQGVLIHHVSDPHIGYRKWSYAEMDRMLADMTGMPPVDVVVVTGDVIDDTSDGSQPLAEQNSYAVPFLANLAGSAPMVVAPGNHDLYDCVTRSAWETTYGRTANTYVDVGPYRFVTFCPDTFTGDDSWIIPDSTWTWLDGVCTTPQNVVLCDHYPPYELGMGLANSLQPPANLDALVSGHSNIVGMLAGHMHFPVENAQSTQMLSIGGRMLPVVTDNSSVFTEPLVRDQLARLQTITTYIDMTPETWQIHYRFHGTRAWSGPSGLRVTTMNLNTGQISHGM
jgi:calcineurin-like phosphoesterase family protein